MMRAIASALLREPEGVWGRAADVASADWPYRRPRSLAPPPTARANFCCLPSVASACSGTIFTN
eukprot:scaffold27829_cov119-Isochrysis_galbana.AAC.5